LKAILYIESQSIMYRRGLFILASNTGNIYT
jgi:hypothetical protein